MDKIKTKYLTAKNILFIVAVWLCLLFLKPSSGSWLMVEHNEDFTYKTIFFTIELLFLIFCFTFVPLLQRQFAKVLLLSIIAGLAFGTGYYMVQNNYAEPFYLTFIHPVTLSVSILFVLEKKYTYALAGYLLGLYLSLFPLLFSLIPVLFYQLWIMSNNSEINPGKVTGFFVRLFMYIIITVLLFVLIVLLYTQKQVFPGLALSFTYEVILNVIVLAISYHLLHKYLKMYYAYRKEQQKFLFVASHIPVLWIIPLYEIIGRTNKGAGGRYKA